MVGMVLMVRLGWCAWYHCSCDFKIGVADGEVVVVRMVCLVSL